MIKSTLLILTGFIIFSLQAQNNDRNTVKSILNVNKLSWDIDARTTYEGDRIVTLNLDNNDITDRGIIHLIPELGNLTKLRVLTVNDNGLTSLPLEIFNCTNLVILELKNNNLSSIPNGISKLTRLKELDLRNNELTQLPSDVGNLPSIFKIQLWGNRLTSLPSELGNLFTLKELYLRSNRLTFLPNNITKLKLNYIDISFNYLNNNTKTVDRWLKKYNYRYLNEQYNSMSE